jgi:2-dehydropantoate 2-reductase
MTRLRVAVVGAGAVGGYYGAKLAVAGHEVHVLARGAHLRAIAERGLMIWSPLGDIVARPHVAATAEDVGVVDLVLFAVKTYDNADALPLLPPLVGPHTMVLTLQNGVRSMQEVADVVGTAHVLAGPTYIATALAGPGFIEQTGTHRRIVYGEAFAAPETPSARVQALAETLAAADIQAEPVGDARRPLWEKFMYLAPFASVTGASRHPAGVLWHDPELRRVFLEAVREVEALAHADGVAVSTDAVAKIEAYMEALPPSTRSSLLIDLSSGRRIENEALAGEVVRRARRLDVPTPVMETLYAVLKPFASGAHERRSDMGRA